MASKPISTDRPSTAAIIAAVLLPPLGIYLMRGLTPPFWIGVALTCLGIVPGMIYALLVILANRDVETLTAS